MTISINGIKNTLVDHGELSHTLKLEAAKLHEKRGGVCIGVLKDITGATSPYDERARGSRKGLLRGWKVSGRGLSSEWCKMGGRGEGVYSGLIEI